MLVKFTKTVWLNIEPEDVRRIDINTNTFEDLTENAVYFVTVTLNGGATEQSDNFKTIDEARACAENLIRTLNGEVADNGI